MSTLVTASFQLFACFAGLENRAAVPKHVHGLKTLATKHSTTSSSSSNALH
jgi:hypothetical protein